MTHAEFIFSGWVIRQALERWAAHLWALQPRSRNDVSGDFFICKGRRLRK
jgi:hypothetical protein